MKIRQYLSIWYVQHSLMYLQGRDLLACTTWFHQSQVYQPICTKLIYTELICTKPHFYHPPKMVARTRESLPSRATQAQGRHPSFRASPLTPLTAFFYCFWPRGKFKVWSRWALVKPRYAGITWHWIITPFLGIAWKCLKISCTPQLTDK